MENKQQQILSEMTNLLATLKSQIEELEIKMAEYQQMIDNQQVDEGVVKEDLVEIVDAEEDVKEEPQADMFEMEVMDIELEPSDDLPFYDDVPSEDAATEDSSELEVAEDLPGEVVDDLPEDAAPVPVAVIDAMTAKQAWRTDMPGSPVRDIRSAISLNDRILFINYLFGEDPIAFQEMLTQLNAMTSFNEAVDAVTAAHPEWDLESDTVYRFMMALRRRLQ